MEESREPERREGCVRGVASVNDGRSRANARCGLWHSRRLTNKDEDSAGLERPVAFKSAR